MKKIIGFFSSDARPLYVEDIYRTLALPERSIIHFRYDQKYIDDDIIANLNSYVNNEGIIFFVTGNNLEIPEKERKKEFHSIRKIVIKEIIRSENTGLFHFHLELGSFYDCTINDFDRNKFVTNITIREGIKHKWIDRVKLVQNHFNNILFFNYEILDKDGSTIHPIYSKLNNDAIYGLDDETEYILKCSFFDKKNGMSSLSIIDDEILKIYYKESSKIAAVVDDRQFKILIRSANQHKTPLQVKLSPTPIDCDDKKYEVISFFEIKKRKISTVLFGLFSAGAFSAVLLSQIFADMLKNNSPLCQVILIAILSLVLIGFSGAMLFRHFNKK